MERLFTNQDSFQQRTLTYSPPLQTAKDPTLPNVSPPIPSPSLTPPHSGTTPTTTINTHNSSSSSNNNNNNNSRATNSIERSSVDGTLNTTETGASLETCAAALDESLIRRLPPRKRMQSLKKQFTKPNLSVPCLSMNLVTSTTLPRQQRQSFLTAMPLHPAATANTNNSTAAYQTSHSDNSNSTTSRSPSPLINIEDDSGDTTETDDEDSWHLHRKRSISESTLLSDDFGRPKQTVIIQQQQQQQQQEPPSSIGSAYSTGLMSSVNSKLPPKSSNTRQQPPSLQSTLDQQPSTKSVTTTPPKLVSGKKTKAGTKKKHERSASSASSTHTNEYPSITHITPATTTAAAAEAAPARRTKKSDGSKSKAKKPTTLYCICQTPYDATRFMIACDECDQWFHGECIGISEKDGEFIDLYFCGVCGKDTGKKTSWKIKCENSACVKSARVGASSSSSLPKYCSYKCSAASQKSRLDMAGKDQHHHQHHQQIQRCMGILRMIEQKQRFLDMTERQAQNYDICGFDSRLVWDNHLWSKVQRVVETEKDGTVILLLQQDSKSRSSTTQQQQHTWPMDAHRRCQHRRHDCRQHQQWPTLLGLELKKERKVQLQAIKSLEKEMDLADASTY